MTDTGRFQYANTTPKALRLAADLVEAGADVHRVFQGVYENVQFAKLKLLARALERAQVLEGGEIVVSHLVRGDFEAVGATEPYSEGIIDVLRAVEGSLVSALIREPPRDGAPAAQGVAALARSTRSTSARSRASRAAEATAQAAGFSSELSVEEITEFIVREVSAQVGSAASGNAAARAARRAGSSSSTSPPGRRRSRSSRRRGGETRARTGHAGTLDPFATGLLLVLSGAATRLQPQFVGLAKRYETEIDLSARTSTGDVEGERIDEHEPPAADELEAAARRPPRRGRAADSRRLRGEDRRRARVRAPSARGRRRDAASARCTSTS